MLFSLPHVYDNKRIQISIEILDLIYRSNFQQKYFLQQNYLIIFLSNTKRMNIIIDYKIIEDLLPKIRLKIDNSFQIRG